MSRDLLIDDAAPQTLDLAEAVPMADKPFQVVGLHPGESLHARSLLGTFRAGVQGGWAQLGAWDGSSSEAVFRVLPAQLASAGDLTDGLVWASDGPGNWREIQGELGALVVGGQVELPPAIAANVAMDLAGHPFAVWEGEPLGVPVYFGLQPEDQRVHESVSVWSSAGSLGDRTSARVGETAGAPVLDGALIAAARRPSTWSASFTGLRTGVCSASLWCMVSVGPGSHRALP